MAPQLRTVTVRIASTSEGGTRAWSDDLPGLWLTCPNHQALCTELTPKIIELLREQGFDGTIVREIHEFIVQLESVEKR
jgi:hypothetical protein